MTEGMTAPDGYRGEQTPQNKPDPLLENEPALTDPHFYINRELSWLEFNQRVLLQALDPTHPLLERVKFLSIVATILDKFLWCVWPYSSESFDQSLKTSRPTGWIRRGSGTPLWKRGSYGTESRLAIRNIGLRS